MALSPDGSETCTIAEDDWGPYQTVDEWYDRARVMVEDIKKILNVEAEYSYKCEHEIGIWFQKYLILLTKNSRHFKSLNGL